MSLESPIEIKEGTRYRYSCPTCGGFVDFITRKPDDFCRLEPPHDLPVVGYSECQACKRTF